MLEITARALSLVAVLGIGFGIKKLGWVSRDDFGLFAKLVLNITLPAALVTGFNDYALDYALLGVTFLGLAVTVVQQVIGYLISVGRPPQQRAFAVMNSGTYNIGAFATPYLAGFMGPQAMIYSTLFDIGNAFASAGVGYGWGMALAGGGGEHRWRDTFRTLARTPILITYVALLVMRLVDLRLPDPVITFTSIVGAANPFLAMLMLGVGLEIRLHRSKYAAAARYLAVRYTFSLIAGYACWTLLPLPAEARLVVVMLLFAPIASMIPGFVGKAGLDVELSAFMASLTLLVAMVAMPALYLLLPAA